MNETLKVLKERRSIRKYRPEQVTEQDLNAILEAGTWAPTAKNLQTPVMVVVQDPETIAHMSALNAEIMGKPGTDPFFGAPTVVVVLADGTQSNWLQDGSLVMGNLMTAAAATGGLLLGQPGHGALRPPGGPGAPEALGLARNPPGRWQLRPGVPRRPCSRPQAPERGLDHPPVRRPL